MLALASEHREVVWHERNLHITCHMFLHAFHHGFHVSHNRVEIHCLMHLLAVPSGNLLFPIELALCEHMLLEKMMRLDDNHRGCGLKAYASLYTYDGVSYVDVTSYPERSRCVTYCLYHINRAHLHAVE